MAFLGEHGLGDVDAPTRCRSPSPTTTRVTRSAPSTSTTQPRALLGSIPDLAVVEIANGDRCCGAAGIYAATQPELAERAAVATRPSAVAATGASVVASANPGCSVQLAHHLAGNVIDVVHPVELLDRAMG